MGTLDILDIGILFLNRLLDRHKNHTIIWIWLIFDCFLFGHLWADEYQTLSELSVYVGESQAGNSISNEESLEFQICTFWLSRFPDQLLSC